MNNANGSTLLRTPFLTVVRSFYTAFILAPVVTVGYLFIDPHYDGIAVRMYWLFVFTAAVVCFFTHLLKRRISSLSAHLGFGILMIVCSALIIAAECVFLLPQNLRIFYAALSGILIFMSVRKITEESYTEFDRQKAVREMDLDWKEKKRFITNPVYPMAVFPAFLSLLTLFFGSRTSGALCTVSFLAVIVLTSAHHGLLNTEMYLKDRDYVSHIPWDLIRTSKCFSVLLACVIITGAGVLGCVLTAPLRPAIDINVAVARLPGDTHDPVDDLISRNTDNDLFPDIVRPEDDGAPSDDGELFARIAKTVGFVVVVSALFIAVYFTISALYKAVMERRRVYHKTEDKIEKIRPDYQKDEHTSIRRARLEGNDPRIRIRLQYIKTIKKATKKRPDAWLSPKEIESEADLRIPELHEQYEKARYDR